MEACIVDEISLSDTNKRVDDLLIELSLFDESDTRELNIVLISDNEEIKKLNYFIFNPNRWYRCKRNRSNNC